MATDVRYGYTASAVDEAVGPRFLRITDFSTGLIDWDSVPYCEISDENIGKYSLASGDVVIARTGPVGSSVHLQNPPKSVFASYLVRFRFDETRCDPKFMGYVLQSPQWSAYVESARTGSVQPQLNATLMRGFKLLLPPLGDQLRISHMLGVLDAKISNNRRIAKMLEEIAAGLFKTRFVDFVSHDDLVESEIGRIPRGWEVRGVGEVLRVVGGSTPSTKEPAYWEGGTNCWVTPKDLSGRNGPILLDTARHITDVGVDRISSGLLPQRTVLMSSRAPVGYTAISFVPLAVNQGFIAVPPSDGIPSEYILFWMRANMSRIKASASGTTFAEISKRAFRPLPMLVPPKRELATFAHCVEPLILRIASCVRENTSLSSIRDDLLPRLISGQIRVGAETELTYKGA
ncbi:MAG TPA: restriction endonuclease subunit S [Fimbriimonas sp.]|nr:restriction endonuclease subunit S [Fimbriimonas sp.]